jgi:uncharacterized protein (TIGR02246 family)
MEDEVVSRFSLPGILLLTCVVIAEGAGQQSDARAEVARAWAEYRAAILDADVATLAKIWTDDYTFTNGRGVFLTKEERLHNIESGATKLESVQETERQMRFYGDTVISTGKVTLKAKYSGQAASGVYRHLSVWVKQGDRWRMAANQITPIVE